MESPDAENKAQAIEACKQELKDMLAEIEAGTLQPDELVICYKEASGAFGYAAPSVSLSIVGLLALNQAAIERSLTVGRMETTREGLSAIRVAVAGAGHA